MKEGIITYKSESQSENEVEDTSKDEGVANLCLVALSDLKMRQMIPLLLLLLDTFGFDPVPKGVQYLPNLLIQDCFHGLELLVVAKSVGSRPSNHCLVACILDRINNFFAIS